MSSFIDRFAIAGTAGVLGLVGVLGIFGFLSLLGAEPNQPLEGLRSVEEVLTPGFDSPFRARLTGSDESGPGPAGQGEAAVGSPSPGPSAQPTETPFGTAVLSVVEPPGEGQETPGPGGATAGPPTRGSTAVPTAPATPVVTPVPTPVPTPPLTPQPEPCSLGGGTPLVEQNGKHVRIEYGSVVSFQVGVLVVDAAGTSAVLRIGGLTEVVGDLGAATLVQAEGRRLSDGTVDAERVEVLCPDGAVG
jgi:hypothetical protein